MRLFAAAAIASLVSVACSSSKPPISSGAQGFTVDDGGVCRYPAGLALASDSVPNECVAHSPGQSCQEGVAGAADGAVTVGSGVCTSLCKPSEYEMTCSGADPDPALGCTIIAIPTPSCCAYYCCPCAE